MNSTKCVPNSVDMLHKMQYNFLLSPISSIRSVFYDADCDYEISKFLDTQYRVWWLDPTQHLIICHYFF